jgi:HK97 family phage prohead protease
MGTRVKSFMIEKAGESASYHFQGYASTYGNVDRDMDVMEKGCFDETVSRKSTIPMLWNHWRNEVIGKIHLSLDEKGLIAEGTFNLKDPNAQHIKDLVDMDALDSMSIGFIVNDYEPIDKTRPFGGWSIKKADVVETSIVTIPANPNATITEIKAMSGDADTLKQIFKEAIKEARQEEKELEEKQKSILKLLNFEEVDK